MFMKLSPNLILSPLRASVRELLTWMIAPPDLHHRNSLLPAAQGPVKCLGLVRLGVTDGEPRRRRLAQDRSQSHADCCCSLSNLRQITANLPRPASSGEFGSVTVNTTETQESLWM
ncbi:hypothetical protein KOW79_007979 [Hemibagrus wyckioides]|uniref:Uncharacterized protein n=1 Tax=Hemibagrus wyckioides TaxID=337641 RepID=A0A9D3NVP4_9TELE|nr:hypothetical protein KOW79_007979 [Hemibagrus wyckioides]